MKSISFVIVFIFVFVNLASASLDCEYNPCSHKELNIDAKWKDMQKSCIKKMKVQIQEELKAAMQYMAMGAHFSRDSINRPGFADMFFKSASEEREHAIKLISYLNMRGELASNVSDLFNFQVVMRPEQTEWASGVDALQQALKLEAYVTKSIRNVIKVCEDDPLFNDYHLVDYLTGDFLEEQYHGQRDIAGKISTLQKMMNTYGAIGEFLFDKKLLETHVI